LDKPERYWPAVEAIGGEPDLMLAAVDECSPTAIEELGGSARLYFRTTASRDAAREALEARGFTATAIDVGDGNWAERCQADLQPVTIGRITIVPASPLRPSARAEPPTSSRSPITIAIPPSVAFGTGHHATTRICVAALQTLDLRGRRVLDVGTGTGVLALAASRLGADEVVGIDNDPDAIEAAVGNLELNAGPGSVSFRSADLAERPFEAWADVVVANLTGAVLQREAGPLTAAIRPGGRLVLGGILEAERKAVAGAFPETTVVWRAQEDEWVGLILELPMKSL
jgi:ribosomal protein L11 methyltransferase